jgi:hypothetical protein
LKLLYTYLLLVFFILTLRNRPATATTLNLLAKLGDVCDLEEREIERLG